MSVKKERAYEVARTGSSSLGPLESLPGEWKADGTGWNMIALPYEGGPANFRVLMNQYSETLSFTFVDDHVANRGLPGVIDSTKGGDQFVVTLDYQQVIHQVAADDHPVSGLAGAPGAAIHHEPGLWLYMTNLTTRDTDAELDIARLGSVPHGNSVLALGHSQVVDGIPGIPDVSGLPIGPTGDAYTSPYLEPYRHFIQNPFNGTVTGVPGFPGFHPDNMNAILQFANAGLGDEDVESTTILTVDSTREDGGVANIPFAVKQAEPVSMKSTFWIQTLKEKDEEGRAKLRLQYSQVVMLDFFRPRRDEFPGRIQWPHISIATLNKVPGSSPYAD
jgi:hypothetical protein